MHNTWKTIVVQILYKKLSAQSTNSETYNSFQSGADENLLRDGQKLTATLRF